MSEDGYKNVFHKSEIDDRVLEIYTQPGFGIGQRACLLQTPHGNVLWDLIAYLDQETVDKASQTSEVNHELLSGRFVDQSARRPEIHRHFAPSLLYNLGGLVRHLSVSGLLVQSRFGVGESKDFPKG